MPQKTTQPTSSQLLNGSARTEDLPRRRSGARTSCALRGPGAMRRRLRGGADGGVEEGSMAVEMAVLAPAIGLLIGFVIAAGRLSVSQGIVQAAAVDSARMASISRTATAAQAAAHSGAEASLQGQPNTCSSYTVQANTAGFAQRVGVPAQVEVTVDCTVPLTDLIPGLPGSKTITKTAISPLDTYRERTQ